ncbi:MAG TPA: hypothetical protein VFT53_06370 [Candidatus Saccharimonadales bacterium]|nr:hypothetical protein [Candidatus Saccharimonadales bacterium]
MGVNIYHAKIKKHRKSKRTIDRLVYVAVALGPLMTLPQVWNVWMTHDRGVSLPTWFAYAVVAVIWLWYGLYHKDKPIVCLQASWLVLDLLIVGGVLVRFR